MGLKDSILSADDLAHEDVTVPEWGGARVRVAEMSALDRVEFDEEVADAKDARKGKDLSPIRLAVLLLRRCLREPDGSAAFDAADLDRLGRKSPRVLLRLFRVAARVNVLSDREADEVAGKSVVAVPVEPPTA